MATDVTQNHFLHNNTFIQIKEDCLARRNEIGYCNESYNNQELNNCPNSD